MLKPILPGGLVDIPAGGGAAFDGVLGSKLTTSDANVAEAPDGLAIATGYQAAAVANDAIALGSKSFAGARGSLALFGGQTAPAIAASSANLGANPVVLTIFRDASELINDGYGGMNGNLVTIQTYDAGNGYAPLPPIFDVPVSNIVYDNGANHTTFEVPAGTFPAGADNSYMIVSPQSPQAWASVAIGEESLATGYQSLAIGGGWASKFYEFAQGGQDPLIPGNTIAGKIAQWSSIPLWTKAGDVFTGNGNAPDSNGERASNRFIIHRNTSYACTTWITYRKSGGDTGYFVRRFIAKDVDGTASIQGSVVVSGSDIDPLSEGPPTIAVTGHVLEFAPPIGSTAARWFAQIHAQVLSD
jgi:hypothetical protein